MEIKELVFLIRGSHASPGDDECLKPRSSIMLPWATNRIMVKDNHPLTLRRRKEIYVRCKLTSQTVVYSVEIIKK